MDSQQQFSSNWFPTSGDKSIIRCSIYATKIFRSRMKQYVLESAKQLDPRVGRLSKSGSRVASACGSSAVSVFLEVTSETHRGLLARRISTSINFDLATEREQLTLMAKAFIMLNMSFYRELFTGKHLHVNEGLLAFVASDMVHRFFNCIKHGSTKPNTFTLEFIIEAVLNGKSRDRDTDLKAKLLPGFLQTGYLCGIDGSRVYLNQILDIPHFLNRGQNPCFRIPFKFEASDQEFDNFWDRSTPWIEEQAFEVVNDVLKCPVTPMPTPSPSPRGSFSLAMELQPLFVNVAHPVPNFVGRSRQLHILKEAITFEVDKTNIFLVCGQRGIGKSELLRELANEIWKEENLGVIWFRADNASNFKKDFEALADHIGIKEAKEFELLLLNIIQVLKFVVMRKTVLIFDQLEERNDNSPVEQTISHCLQHGKGVVFILVVSSRLNAIEGCDYLMVPGLETNEAQELLENTVGDIQCDGIIEFLKFLSKRFGNHPLAIRQLLSFVREEFKFPSGLEYLQDLVSKTIRNQCLPDSEIEGDILKKKLDKLTHSYSYSVVELWDLKVKELSTIDSDLGTSGFKTGPNSLQFLNACAILQIILKREYIKLKLLKFLLGYNDIDIRKILKLLTSHCLVKCKKKSTKVPNYTIVRICLNPAMEAGILATFLKAIQSLAICQVEYAGDETDFEVRDTIFGTDFLWDLQEILQYTSETYSELEDRVGSAISSLLRATRNYDLHQAMVEKYRKNWRIQYGTTSQKYLSIRLEIAYRIAFCEQKFDEAEREICHVLSTLNIQVNNDTEPHSTEYEEEMLLLEKRNAKVLRFQACMDLARMRLKQGYLSQAEAIILKQLVFIDNEMKTDSSSVWKKLKSVALQLKNMGKMQSVMIHKRRTR